MMAATPICPKCGSADVGKVKVRGSKAATVYRCNREGCQYQGSRGQFTKHVYQGPLPNRGGGVGRKPSLSSLDDDWS